MGPVTPPFPCFLRSGCEWGVRCTAETLGASSVRAQGLQVGTKGDDSGEGFTGDDTSMVVVSGPTFTMLDAGSWAGTAPGCESAHDIQLQ